MRGISWLAENRLASQEGLCSVEWLSKFVLITLRMVYRRNMYRGADKSLARPGRKQANVSVRIAWISFGALPCRKKKNLMTARVSMLLKSRASLTCFRACFLPGRAKDLSAPRWLGFVFMDALWIYPICVSILLFVNDHKHKAPKEKY